MSIGALIGALRVSLSAETSSFEAGMKRSQRTAQKTASSIQGSFGKANAAFKGFATGFISALTIGALARATKAALDYAGSLAEVAQQVGVTARDLQVLRFAGGQVGISTEEMDKALQKFTKSLGDARNGSAEAIKTFKAIGFTNQDIAKLDVHDALMKTADGIAAVGDRAARASPETRLFGRAGQQLDPLLSQGSRGINELAAAAEKLGVVLSDEEIKKADDTADKLEALHTVLKARISGAVADNADSILSLANALGKLAIGITRFMSSNPEAALGILGALAGARFGLPGAAAGGLIGAIAGGNIKQSADDANMDIEFRRRKLHEARDAVNSLKSFEASGGIFRLRRGSGKGGDIRSLQAEFDKQVRLARAAIVANTKPKITTPTGTLPDFLASSGGKKAKTDHTAGRLLSQQHDALEEQLRSEEEILQAKQDLSRDYTEQASLQIQILDNQRAQYKADLDYQVGQYRLSKGQDGISQAQADQLLAQYDIADGLKREKVKQDERLRRADEYAALDQADIERQREIGGKKADLAETASERREIELELLRLAYEEKRQALQHILDTSADFVELENARRDLANLNKNFALDKQGVLQSTRGPLEDYLASLPTTAAKANEALERLEVEGFQGLFDAAGKLTQGFHSAIDALLQTLQNFISGLIQLQLQRAAGGFLQGGGGNFLGAITGLFGGSGGFDSAGFNSIVSSNYAALGIPGFAGGGWLNILGRPGIDRNVLALNGLPIAKVSYGERLNIGNDNKPMMPPPFVFNNYARMSPSEARETGMQAAAGWNLEMARSRSKGISG